MQRRKLWLWRWYRVLAVLGAVVVFCTTYALILPAITLEQTCPLTEHTHSTGCYAPENPQTLVCQLSEHIHTDACAPPESPSPIADGTVPTTGPEETTAPTQGQPLTLLPIDPSLSYKTDGSEWQEITGAETNIPGDATFRLQVGFQVKIEDLKNANYQMIYQPLPEFFRVVKASDNIQTNNGDTSAGTMTVEDRTVTLTFDKDWLDKQSDTTLTGSFFVEAKADLTQIPEDGKTEITIGNATIKINFDGDLVAKYGEVTLEKTMGELVENVPDESGIPQDYINYTLTVTAGPDGCVDVRVEDRFTNGSQYIADYIVPTDSKAEFRDGKLIWTIGDMKPNESKTLTYQVRLKDYLGVNPKEALTNLAEVYSKKYKRTEDTETFLPQGKATMSKVAGEFIKNDTDPGGYIRYTVWVHADEGNNYTLENVTIWDSLDGSVDNSYKTDDAFLPFLSYDVDSFAFYQGGQNNQNGTDGLTKLETTTGPQLGDGKKSFRYNVGNLKPGESRVLIYHVKVDPGAFTQTNDTISVYNRAYIITDPSRGEDGNQRLQSYWTQKNITLKKWARKLLGDRVEADTTVTMGTSGSFNVPQGSYRYQVVVNEAGDWDVSSASMHDDLHSANMAYVGYVRVDAYKIDTQTSFPSDEAAAEQLAGMTPEETKWVKIAGESSFTFTPKGIGLPDGNYAYLLTYYAQPKNMGQVSSVIVANQFDLAGMVGVDGNYYQLAGIQVSASVTLQGSNYFNASKDFWYYDAEAEGGNHGAMYWVIRLRGNRIPEGTSLRDAIADGNHTSPTVAQAFIARDVEHLDELKNLEDANPFTGYTQSEADSNNLVLTFPQGVTLAKGQSLYIVVKTYPTSVPQGAGNSEKYENRLEIRDPGENAPWVDHGSDLTYLTSGSTIYKSMEQVFQVTNADPTGKTVDKEWVAGGTNTILQLDILSETGDGLYVAWKVTVNQNGTLSGRYRVVDAIPEGMEVAYIQQYSSTGYGKRPWFVRQEELTSQGYTETVRNYSARYDQNPLTAYYYTKGQEVIWDVDGLQQDLSDPKSKQVEFLLVCRVVDSELFLSGKTKTYTNQVTLQDTQGQEVGTSSAEVELTKPTLSKKGTYNSEVNGGVYPFEINLNEFGVDLAPGSDTIKLIDEMCEVLILDPTSIRVVNTKTGVAVPFTPAISGQTLTLTIPDDQPLTITYSATINAAPGTPIAIENNAHWEGYTTTPGGSVSVPNFSYSVGAVVGTSTQPELTVVKVDQYNTTQALPGATFTLREVELKDGALVAKADGTVLTATTDATGTLVFGKDEKKLQCNVIYSLTETMAPAGYVLDGKPQYFLFAKRENGAYPDSLEACKAAGVQILYTDRYTYTALNHKGLIEVTKVFQNADGSPLAKLDGTYTFGLFAEENLETPLDTVTIRWANGQVTPQGGTAVFTNVELGKTYRVYELGDDGKPIQTGSGVVGGVPFQVSYSVENISVTAGSWSGSITVTNRIDYPILPNTGGAGTHLYTLGGVLLMIAAAVLMYQQRKRGREGNPAL